MARTAPVPNIPAIPGMNPGAFVMGGGGGSGGGGGGDGDGSGGEQGAGDGSGGDGANGDGQGAGACGQGSTGSCTQCSAHPAAGDPVDPITGRVYTLPAYDLVLPGPLDLRWTRAYSSAVAETHGAYGFGWNHSLGWVLEVRRRSIVVTTGDGRAVEFDTPALGETSISTGGWVLKRTENHYHLAPNENTWRVFEVTEGTRLHRLSAIVDFHGNIISLMYQRGHLSSLIDSAGRRVGVEHDRHGRITAISVFDETKERWESFASFVYDDRGNLVRATNADGHATTYAYDDDHFLVKQRYPTGFTVHYRYDASKRCVETWGDYGDREDPALADDVPENLADGKPAKGVLHARIQYFEDGYSEVNNSYNAARMFANAHGSLDKGITDGEVTTRTFDPNGNVATIVDPLGGVTEFEWDRRGRLLSRTDADGRTIVITRDDKGRMTGAEDAAGNAWQVEHDDLARTIREVDPRGAVTTYAHDKRGLLVRTELPSGDAIHYTYDAHANLTERAEANGATWQFRYDYFGRCVFQRDPIGGEKLLEYTAAGLPAKLTRVGSGITLYEFDGLGCLTKYVDPDGRVTRFEWGGYRVHCATMFPDGTSIAMKYDRELQLVQVHNEAGEVHRRKRDTRGRAIEDHTFDGRNIHYAYDKAGRLVRTIATSGDKVIRTLSPAGALLATESADGVVEELQYDARGDLCGITGPGYEHIIVRDEVGNVVSDTQQVDGEVVEVTYAYDINGERIARSTSLGHEMKYTRDAAGIPSHIALDGGEAFTIARDLLGREQERAYGGGVVSRTAFDARGNLIGQSMGSNSEDGSTPAWRVQRSYAYSPGCDLLRRDDDVARSSTSYTYDERRRLLELQADTSERFSYDERGNVQAVGVGSEARSYGAGSVLRTRGKQRYVYNDDGRLIRKTSRDGSGDWHYAWDGLGRLSEVRSPNDIVTTFQYDACYRRLAKRSVRASTGEEISHTRFVWDGDTLVHEIRRSFADAGDPVVEERTYCSDVGIPVPWAQRVRRGSRGGRGAESWQYYLNEPNGAPDVLFDKDGVVLAEMSRTAWGITSASKESVTTTPMRFAGQYEDPEIELFYNRHRYYDPDIGRYISADPAGLVGDLNAFVYGLNPLGYVDPLGLANCVTATLTHHDGRVETFPGTWATSSHPDGHSEQELMDSLRGRTDLAGSTLEITSQSVPSAFDHRDEESRRPRRRRGESVVDEAHACGTCAPRLDTFASDNGMRITYERDRDADNDDANRLYADYRDPDDPVSNLQEYSERRDGARAQMGLPPSPDLRRPDER